jgi:hypothetical protein
MSPVTFTPEKAAKLRRAYDRALRKGEDQFVFEGNVLLVSYAYYLLEYLEERFKAS